MVRPTTDKQWRVMKRHEEIFARYGGLVNVSVRANLVLGSDGATTLNGSSAALSSAKDRNRFHAMRAEFDVIVIGGKTAITEPYQKTPIPLVVVSRNLLIPESLTTHPALYWWQISPAAAIAKCLAEFGNRVLIEGGPNFLIAALPEITEFAITRTKISGGENKVDLTKLLSEFTLVSEEVLPDEIFQIFKRVN